MNEEAARMSSLQAQGFHCSQILLIMGLERQGKENPDLVRAMTGLANGLGDMGRICGALTGAICLLGLYAGRGDASEQEHPLLNVLVQDLVTWFDETYGSQYGSTDCQAILQDDPWNRMLRCPVLVVETYAKVMALLGEHGFLTGSNNDTGS